MAFYASIHPRHESSPCATASLLLSSYRRLSIVTVTVFFLSLCCSSLPFGAAATTSTRTGIGSNHGDNQSVTSKRELKRMLSSNSKGKKKKKKKQIKIEGGVHDVIIIGAGAAGAAAAREFLKWNDKKKVQKDNKVKYKILESTDRIGGRIYDIQFGNGTDENDKENIGVWGGFDSDGRKYTNDYYKYTTAPTNIGCNCQGTPVNEINQTGIDGCETITVEAGAWNFIGDRGIKTACKPEDDGWYEPIVKHEKCKYLHPNINRLYALSQGQGGIENGALEQDELLNVFCGSFDSQQNFVSVENETRYKFIDLDIAYYYGFDSDGELEMVSMNTTDAFLPTTNETMGKAKVIDFINEIDKAVDDCVGPAGTAIYYQWYNNKNETPFEMGATGVNSSNWTVFDQTFDTVPSYSFVEWNTGPQRRRQMKWCRRYRDQVQSYLNNQAEISNVRAKQIMENFNRWMYDAAYVTEDVSFANFYSGLEGECYIPPWGVRYNFVTDKRGLATIIKKIMPGPKRPIKFNTRVTNIDYSGKHRECKGKVLIKAVVTNKKKKKREKYYCAKKVISTVSFGVMQNKGDLFKPSIKQEVLDGPYLGNGILMKVFMRFPKKFWDDNFVLPYLMLNDFRRNETDHTVKANLIYSVEHLLKYNPSVVEDYVRENSPDSVSSTLFVFIASPDLQFMDINKKKIPKDVIGDKIWKLIDPLRKEYGDKYMDPNCFYYYNWGLDKNTYGSYSVWKPGKTYSDFEIFYQPLRLGGKKNGDTDADADADQVVWLSGESSCAYRYGSIMGGYEAGSRDARAVLIDLYQDKATTEGIHTFSACGLQRGKYEDYCLAAPFADDYGYCD